MSFFPDTRLKVTPIVFYPSGVPTDSTWHDRWLLMLNAAQQKFHAMLKGRDTFDLDQSSIAFNGSLTAAQYKALPNDGVETILAELLQHAAFNAFNRYTLPYCLAVLMIDPERAWGDGGGRNFNGKINQGGGILVIPHWHFDEDKLQSTLVHELGHAFGLVHSWDRAAAHGLAEASQLHECYYGQLTSPSIMSYNKANQTNSLDPTQIPGCLLGDEIDALSQNKLVFPGLFFDPATDFDCSPVQTGCPPHDGTSRALWLGPMTLFGCATSHGSKEGTKIANLNDTPARNILANGGEPWDVAKKVVWRSGPLNPAGWVSLWITFPCPVTLDRVVTYSQYGRLLGRASAVQVEALHPNGFFAVLEQITAEFADAAVTFAPTKSRIWKLSFHGDQSDFVILRGFCSSQVLAANLDSLPVTPARG